MSVMLVDSVGMITGTISGMLQPLGFYRIYTAKSAEEALQIIGSGKEINLLISTWRLKTMSGAQLVESLRGKYKELPMFLIVDSPDKNMRTKAERIGVSGLLVQPLDEKKVVQAVEDSLAPFVDQDEEDYALYLQSARQSAHKGQYGEAVAAYQAALAIKPSEEISLYLADALRDAKQTSEAEHAYIALIRANPSNFSAYFSLASLYMDSQRPGDALRLLAYALNIANQSPEENNEIKAGIMLRMGEAELLLQQMQKALKYFDQAVSLDPKNTELAVKAADSLVQIGALEESERFYQSALAVNPNMAHVYNRLGIAYRKQAKFVQALDLYTKALEYSPHDENLYYNIARNMWEMGDFDGAEDFLAKSLQIKPEFDDARRLLTVVKKGLKPASDQ
jgi:tetratricopeptide (TPR) repeat protein